MDYGVIVAHLRAQRDAIEKAIASLEEVFGTRRRRGRPPGRSRSVVRGSNGAKSRRPEPALVNQHTRAASAKAAD